MSSINSYLMCCLAVKRRFFFLILAPLWLYAAPPVDLQLAAQLAPKLNSERIAHFFGNYDLEPIPFEGSPFGECRISNLYSLSEGRKVMRTLAIVDFEEPIPKVLESVHKEIKEGKSVGLALRNDGWKIEKSPLYFGTVELSSNVRNWMEETGDDSAAVHIYRMTVSKDGQIFPYCKIIEVHSPQYLDLEWLLSMNPAPYSQDPESFELLRSLDSFIAQFPEK